MAHRQFKLAKLLEFGRRRYHADVKSPVILPREDTDLVQYLGKDTTLEFARLFFKTDIHPWNKELVEDMLGRPQLCLLNCICIIDIRKSPKMAAPALSLLKRIWIEHPDVVSRNLSLRWLTSTMQAVALGSDDAIEKAVCYVGITYAGMIKMYESERRFMGLAGNAPYLPRLAFAPLEPDPDGLGHIDILSQDIGRNLNADVYHLSAMSDFSGAMLQEIIERIAARDNVFSRLDAARAERSGDDLRQDRFCFLNRDG